MVNKKQPEIRFTGFTDDWTKRRLKEVYTFKYGQFNNNPNNGGNYPIYGANGIIGGYDKFNSENAIVIGHMGAYAGHVLWAEGKHFVTYNGTMGIADEKILHNRFGYYLVTNLDIPKLAAGSGQPFVSYSDLNEIKVRTPTIQEQQKIYAFFQKLDKLIALHARKLELLNELKKGLLQKMFPKAGANVPEVRFAEFTADWKQHKLSEGTSKIGDGLHGTPTYTEDGDVFFINGNNLMKGKIVITKETKLVTASEQSKDDKSLNSNTILMSINGTIGNLALYNNEKLMLGKSTAYLTMSDFDKKFIYAYLQTMTVKNYFLNNLTGTTIKNLGLKTIRNTKLFIPTSEEQKKIGVFFTQLDDTITLYQRELYLLKKMKKGFLKKMFV